MEDLPGPQGARGPARRSRCWCARSTARRARSAGALVKASAVEGEPRLAVNVIEDVTDVKRAELGQRFLAEAGAVLASGLDYEQTLGKVADLAVPRLADWCSVTLPAGDWLRSVAVAHVDPAKRAFAADYDRRWPNPVDAPIGAAQVLRDGSSQLIGPLDDALLEQAIADPEQRAALQSLALRWVMLVPMVAGPRIIGVISFVSSESGRRFTHADLELAEELGRRAGVAVENARLYQERSHIAATLQRGLLPDELPADPGPRRRLAVPAGGGGEPRRRRLLRRVRDPDRLDAARRRRHRPRRRGRGADRSGAPHAAHGGDAARRSRRRVRAAQPGARQPRRPDPVHRRPDPRRPGCAQRHGPVRRPPAAAAAARRRGAAGRALRPDARRVDGRATGPPSASSSSPATRSWPSATASPTRSARTGASGRSACSKRCAASPGRRRR